MPHVTRGALLTLIGVVASYASAQPQVYEGFQYPQGTVAVSTMNGGSGWSGSFTGSPSAVPIAASSLSFAAAPASSGRALGFTTDTSGLRVTRNLASPLSGDYWGSLLFRRLDFPSSMTLSLGLAGPNTPAVSLFLGGYGLTQGFDSTYNPWPGGVPAAEMLLFRVSPVGAGDRQIDLWLNPAPGALPASNVSKVFADGSLNQISLSIGAYTVIDEIRFDRNLAEVLVPSPGASCLALVMLAATRRRRLG